MDGGCCCSAFRGIFLVECECLQVSAVYLRLSHMYIHIIHFLYLDVPEAPLNVRATALAILHAQLFENDCEVLVKWDPPANSVDITHYMVYVPAPNVNVTTNSLITSLLLRNCPERFSINVAAVNNFGCIGINSSDSEVYVTSQPTSPSPTFTSTCASTSTSESPESSKYP